MEVMHDVDYFIGVFLLRRGAVIPMHNHPRMSVIRSTSHTPVDD